MGWGMAAEHWTKQFRPLKQYGAIKDFCTRKWHDLISALGR